MKVSMLVFPSVAELDFVGSLEVLAVALSIGWTFIISGNGCVHRSRPFVPAFLGPKETEVLESATQKPQFKPTERPAKAALYCPA